MKIDQERWQLISPLLDELLDADGVQRAARLVQLQATDPALADQVTALLAHQSAVESEQFLEGSASAPLDAATLAGETIGDYTLERPIGQGGMGTVWLARRSDGRYEGKAAVKFLNLASLGHGGAERFRREGNALAKLAHSNITHLIDAGLSAGQPYLVLEYVEGEPIDRWCDARALDVATRIRLFLQVASAVSHAHGRLILHRDLKPSNILVTAEGRAKLLDFGIAKLLDDGAQTSAPTEITRLGAHGFTPEYAAPEQVQRSAATTATDVYALGVLLHVLLTGTHPTGGATPLARLRALIEQEPKRPSEAAMNVDLAVARARAMSPSQLARTLRGDLDNIVAKALKKSPDERYPTVDALADDLRRYLSNEPVSAQADSVGYRVRKFIRRHRVAVMMASAAVVTLIATSAVAVWQLVEANAQREVAQREAARATSRRDFMNFVLSDAGSSGRPFTTLELLARAEKLIDAQYGSAEDPLAIEQLLQIGEVYSSLGQRTRSLQLAEEAYQRAARGGHTELRQDAACSLGREMHFSGKLEEAAALLDRTIAEIRSAPTGTGTLAGCMQLRAGLELSRGHVASALATAREAVTLATKASDTSPTAQIPPRMVLAIALRVAGERKLADDTYRDLANLLRRVGRDRTVDAAVLSSNWGKLKSDAGDVLGAARLIESALAIGRALRPDGNPDYVTSLNYAQTLLIQHRLDEAERYFSLARRVAEAENDGDFYLLALLGLAGVERERGNFGAAWATLKTADEFARARFPPQHRAYNALLLETGRLHLAGGSFAAAATALSEVVAQNAAAKAKTPNHALTLAELALAELGRGDVARAATLAAQASVLAEEFTLSGAPSYWIGRCLLVQAEIEKALHHAAASQRLAARSLEQLSSTLGPDHPLTRQAAALSMD